MLTNQSFKKGRELLANGIVVVVFMDMAIRGFFALYGSWDVFRVGPSLAISIFMAWWAFPRFKVVLDEFLNSKELGKIRPVQLLAIQYHKTIAIAVIAIALVMVSGFRPASALSPAQAVRLVEPASACESHVVQPGENLYRIGLRYGVDSAVLAQVNDISDVRALQVGVTLEIPCN